MFNFEQDCYCRIPSPSPFSFDQRTSSSLGHTEAGDDVFFSPRLFSIFVDHIQQRRLYMFLIIIRTYSTTTACSLSFPEHARSISILYCYDLFLFQVNGQISSGRSRSISMHPPPRIQYGVHAYNIRSQLVNYALTHLLIHTTPYLLTYATY